MADVAALPVRRGDKWRFGYDEDRDDMNATKAQHLR